MSIEQVKTQKDYEKVKSEQELIFKWRQATSFCKKEINVQTMEGWHLDADHKMAFEKCIT